MAETCQIITFGCRLNAYESEGMQALGRDVGLTNTVIVNSCAVTAEAVRQARQAIRKAARDNPGARIVVTGCAAQIDPHAFAEMAEVDHVVGNGDKLVRSTFEALAAGTCEPVRVTDVMELKETAHHLIDGFGNRARAYLQVQNGCNHRCTFCVIPYGRGNARSVPAGAVVDQVRQLVEAGYREVVLTGVDITSYGSDLPGSQRLGTLVRQILKLVPELDRLRLSSIDSIEADADLLSALAEEERLMPHLHLSLQSGDDLILKRMKRRHLRADAIAFCAEARRLRPEVTFGADLIAGFPTEDAGMFQQSLELVDACDLAFLHVFPFSARPGTPAARMPQLDRQLVKERAARLREKGRQALERHLQRWAGRRAPVLMEREALGRAPDFTEVRLDDMPPPGSLVEARITGHNDQHLTGTAIS